MNKKQFDNILKSITGKNNLIDIEKLKAIPDDIKEEMVFLLVRYRHAILKDLIPAQFDISWLRSMGYLYDGRNKHFSFLCLCEHGNLIDYK